MEKTRTCTYCGVVLTDENWPEYLRPTLQRHAHNSCRLCWVKRAAEGTKKAMEKDPEHVRALARQRTARWKDRNPDADTRYYQAHKSERADYARSYLLTAKTEAIRILGGKCLDCGLTDIRVLQVNHKNGGGRKESRFGTDMYLAIINGKRKTDDLDVRCANHNIIYEYERGSRKLPVRG